MINRRRFLTTSAVFGATLVAFPRTLLEASGAESGLALARWALRPRGTLVLKSTHHGDRSFDFALLVVDEITVVGSRCGPFAPALHLLQTRAVDPTPLIDGTFALAETPAAFVQAVRLANSSSVRRALEALVEDELVVVRDGAHRVADPFFAAWLRG